MKYSTATIFHKFSSTIFNERLNQANLLTKADIADFITIGRVS